MTAPLIDASDLVRIYRTRKGPFARPTEMRAVDGVSLRVMPGETLGIVGESGSGKSTLGRMLLGIDPAREGAVVFDGKPAELSAADVARIYGDALAPQNIPMLEHA